MSKIEVLRKDLCLLCGELLGDIALTSQDITSSTETSLKTLLTSFIPFNTPHQQTLLTDSLICQNCYLKLDELDEHQMTAEKIKIDILHAFNSTHRLNRVSEPKIKLEEIDIPLDEEYLDDYESSDISEEPKINDSVPTTSSQSRKRRRTPKKMEPIENTEVLKGERGEVSWKCLTCSKIMKRKAQMQQHVLIHKNERNICCQECGAMFKTPSCLYSHRKIHKERKKLNCDLCGKFYDQKYYLIEHMNAVHLDLKKHVCPSCGVSFARKASLVKHGDVHRTQAERKVVCEVCGFRTHTKPDMKRHMKTHTGEKNYACEICDKRFACRYNVSAHIKSVHHGIRPKIDESKLRCILCGKRFPRQRQLRRHLFVEHNMMEYAAEFTGENH